MIIRLTLVGLILVLIAVITISYYVNKEGFEDIFDATKTDLSKAVNTVSTDLASGGSGIIRDVPNPMEATSSTPKRFDIKPEISLSPTGYDAMSLQQKSELLKDIQKVVKNELIANRLTTPLIKDDRHDDKYNKYCDKSTSTKQGKEYDYNCSKKSDDDCSKKSDESCPDMSKYIKKDAIPCWGCKLDY